MARPLRIEYQGAFYHITSRGNERKDIYKGEQDFIKFLSYLETGVKRYKAVIHVYCLMKNHYHLLLETPRGNLSQIMRHINGAYTTYFNTKRKRTGHLFQGRYKAILVDADEYIGELSRYIHLNPVRAGIVSKPEEYYWSSYQCYIGKKKTPGWLKTDFILGYFGDKTKTARGKYDWFIGFAETAEKKIAIAVLTVHGKLWWVKSSMLARQMVEKIFREPLKPIAVRRQHGALGESQAQ